MDSHSTTNPAMSKAGKPTEKIFKLGAARVMKPTPMLTNNKVMTTGNEINSAETNINAPQAVILPSRSCVNIDLPIGNKVKDSSSKPNTIKCPPIDKNTKVICQGFTGAQGKRIGKLEYAHGGTLFLDEIESMPLAQQVKLLRVLQEQKLERLGSNQSIHVDLRIIAATKPDLLEEARAGRFREDLAYRLNVAQLRLPPLRERREDIPLLFDHFAQSAAERLGRSVEPLSGVQLGRLLSHDWPGNVRELANVAERQVLGLGEPEPEGIEAGQSLAAQQEAFEAHCLKAALTRHKGDIKAVLAELQLPRRTFNEKMQRHGLARDMFLKDE